MNITVARTSDKEYGRYIKALFCGDPGAGKTLISSTFPNPLYASAEGGLMSVADRAVPFVKIEAIEQLQIIRANLSQPAEVRQTLFGMPVDSIIVDTIDEVARLLVRERLEANKKEQMAMADWGWLGDQLRAIIRSFRNLDMHVVFTCHLKSAEDSETGRIFFKPAIQGAVGDEIAGYVDLALLLKAQPMSRVVGNETERVLYRYLQTYPDPTHPWIKDRSGRLPQEFEVTFENDFDRMNHLIYGEGEVEVEVATPEVEEEPQAVPEESVPEPSHSDPQETETPVEQNLTDGVDDSPPVGEMPYTCADCGTGFDNPDQKDLSEFKIGRHLCAPCYREASKPKARKAS